MKRSKMIQKSYNDSNVYQLIAEAEEAIDIHYTLDKILAFFENNGMLPPDNFTGTAVFDAQKQFSARDIIYAKNIACGNIPTNTWEPEN